MLLYDNGTDDHELLEMLKQGDETAFDVLYERYWRSLFVAANARVGDEDVAKDIVQNLLIDVWQKRADLQVNTSLKQFLFGAVKLQVLQYFRSEDIKKNALENAVERMDHISNAAAEMSAYLDLEKIVSEEVATMPVNMKRSYLLRNESYSIKEIARDLDLAEQTVSNNITEALKRLKSRLKVEYPDRYIQYVAVLMTLFMKN